MRNLCRCYCLPHLGCQTANVVCLGGISACLQMACEAASSSTHHKQNKWRSVLGAGKLLTGYWLPSIQYKTNTYGNHSSTWIYYLHVNCNCKLILRVWDSSENWAQLSKLHSTTWLPVKRRRVKLWKSFQGKMCVLWAEKYGISWQISLA